MTDRWRSTRTEKPDTFICADVTAPSYTASLDAALALVEEKLPGWWYELSNCPPLPDATLTKWSIDNKPSVSAEARTPALAIIAAMFAALEASHD